MPLVTWEPYDWSGRGTEQPKYSLRMIFTGKHNAYIRRWARGAAEWGKTLYLRFAHEMNGDWYPWSPGVNGNSVSEYTRAWKHVHKIFRKEGAKNVRWIWSPNNRPPMRLSKLDPGDEYVAWIGINGYNWGSSQNWSRWQSLPEVFGPSYRTLESMTNKPMMITETASAEMGGDKATWIRQGFFDDIPSTFPRVRALIWFNDNKEKDWRVNSSSSALTAYQKVAASSQYQGYLPQ